MRKAFVILNEKSGSVSSDRLADDIEKAFRTNGVEAVIRKVTGPDIEKALREGLSSDADVICSAGGDGTLLTIAGELLGEGKPLGIIPLGTINHLARNLDIPINIEGSVEAIAKGVIREVDVGSVNGTLFLNDSNMGLVVYAMYAAERQRGDSMLNKVIRAGALLKMVVKLVARFPLTWYVVRDAEGNMLRDRTAFVTVTDNRYDFSAMKFAGRETLTSGKLTLYFPRAKTRKELVGLFLKTLAGKMNELDDLEIIESPEFTIDIPRKKKVMVGTDGEFKVYDTPLRYRLTEKRLRVYAPKPEEAGKAADEGDLSRSSRGGAERGGNRVNGRVNGKDVKR